MKQITVLLLALFSAPAMLQAQTVQSLESEKAAEYIAALDMDKSAIIDGRTTDMYKNGHIENAVQINAFEADATEKLQAYMDKEELVIYCTRHNRASALIEKIQKAGYTGKITSIKDGLNGWKANDLKVVQEKPKKSSSGSSCN